MIRSILRSSGWAALSFFCAAPLAFPSVTMELVGAGPNNLAGVYIGPYSVAINGVPTPAICDDYSTETYFNKPWTADVTTLAAIVADPSHSGAKFIGQADAVTKYQEVAWLSLQLFTPVSTCAPGYICPAGTNNQADIQFAIWQVFDDPKPFLALGEPDKGNAAAWLKAAQDQSLTNFSSLGDLSTFSVYTANPLNTSQEFIVRTPEASALALLGVDLSAVGGLILLFRRKRTSQQV